MKKTIFVHLYQAAIKRLICRGTACRAQGECHSPLQPYKGIFALMLILSLFADLPLYPQLADSPWPMFRHDQKHTARSPSNGPETPILKWEDEVGCGEYFIIGSEGELYNISGYSGLCKVDANGVKIWTFDRDFPDWTIPLLSYDGTIYVGAGDSSDYYNIESYLFAVNPDGTEKWKFKSKGDVTGAPAIGEDGTIYFNSTERFLYALNPDGTLKWHFRTEAAPSSSPAVDDDEAIYIGTQSHYFYAVNPDGTLKWKFYAEEEKVGSAVIADDGSIYLNCEGDNSYLYSLTKDGDEKWRFPRGRSVGFLPCLGPDGTLYFLLRASDNSYIVTCLAALTPDGEEKWRSDISGYFYQAPIVDSNGTIYTGTGGNDIYAFYPDGKLKWQFTINNSSGGGYYSTIGHDGSIYKGSSFGVYVICEDDVPPAVDILSPHDNDYVTNKVKFTLTAKDANGIKSVELGIDGSFSPCEFDGVNWIYQWDTSALPVGTSVKVRARATDSAYLANTAYSKEMTIEIGEWKSDYWVNSKSLFEDKDGSKENPWLTITEALRHITGSPDNPQTNIHVASGTYNIVLGETIPLVLKSNMNLVGEGADTTIINALKCKESVISITNCENLSISGFTISGGYDNGIWCINSSPKISFCNILSNRGRGIYCNGSNPEINNCLISKNYIYGLGGGMFFSYSNPIIKDCVISENSANELDSAGGGCFSSHSNLLILDTSFLNNTAYGGTGGGLFLQNSTNAYLENCIIKDNSSELVGGKYGYGGLAGGFYCYESNLTLKDSVIEGNIGLYGGGIYSYYSTLNLLGCTINDNHAYYYSCNYIIGGTGGGVSTSSSHTKIIACEIKNNNAIFGAGLLIGDSSPLIQDSIISFNEAHKDVYSGNGIGGGFYLGSINPRIFNCLITNNIAESNGSGIYNVSSGLKIENSTIADNISDGIYNSGNKPYIVNSIVRDNTIIGIYDASYSNIFGVRIGNGNIDADPLFTWGPYGYYYLSQIAAGQEKDSPCLDAGGIIDDNYDLLQGTTRTDGALDTGTVDMGFHFPPYVLFNLYIPLRPNDFSAGDRIVLTLDISIASVWLGTYIDVYLLMLDPDGIVYSGMDWEEGAKPLIARLSLFDKYKESDIMILDSILPSEKPPIKKSGEYRFFIAAAKAGTSDLMSNVSDVKIRLE
ncbi:PQQ-binding-like beta-propeller repeat protein [bacterium]|nr:PQQ-binding-like beta-propeller repeat protein [bacterium]